jgi:hypothetical protein
VEAASISVGFALPAHELGRTQGKHFQRAPTPWLARRHHHCAVFVLVPGPKYQGLYGAVGTAGSLVAPAVSLVAPAVSPIEGQKDKAAVGNPSP